MQKDLLRLGSRLDPQDSSSPQTPPSSASPASSVISRRWRTGSPWPGADVLDQSDDAFSIEREARLHRQAAGKTKTLLTLFCLSYGSVLLVYTVGSELFLTPFLWTHQL